jgi:hypothetical protein
MFLLLITGMGGRIPDFERHDGQSSENEARVDFSLFVTPNIIPVILKYLYMKSCPVAVDPVIVFHDKEKWRDNPKSVPVNGVIGRQSKWTDGKLENFSGRNNLRA